MFRYCSDPTIRHFLEVRARIKHAYMGDAGKGPTILNQELFFIFSQSTRLASSTEVVLCRSMAEIFLRSQDDRNSAWIPIDDPVRDRDGYLQLFGIKLPSWSRHPGYHDLHLVRHDYPLGDTAVAIWDASTRLTSSRSLMKYLEESAREARWYDAERFPSVKEHAGKLGMIVASATLLHKYLKTRPLDRPGYYNGRHVCVISGPPFEVGNRQQYRP